MASLKQEIAHLDMGKKWPKPSVQALTSPLPSQAVTIYTDHFSKRGLPQDIDLFAKNQILESWYLFEVARLITESLFGFSILKPIAIASPWPECLEWSEWAGELGVLFLAVL